MFMFIVFQTILRVHIGGSFTTYGILRLRKKTGSVLSIVKIPISERFYHRVGYQPNMSCLTENFKMSPATG